MRYDKQSDTESNLSSKRVSDGDGTRAATSRQKANDRVDGSRSVLAGGSCHSRSPDEPSHSVSLEARGSHARRSRATRWKTWTSRESASPATELAGVEVSSNLAACKQPGAKGTARAVGCAAEH